MVSIEPFEKPTSYISALTRSKFLKSAAVSFSVSFAVSAGSTFNPITGLISGTIAVMATVISALVYEKFKNHAEINSMGFNFKRRSFSILLSYGLVSAAQLAANHSLPKLTLGLAYRTSKFVLKAVLFTVSVKKFMNRKSCEPIIII